MKNILLIVFSLMAFGPGPALACGERTDCELGERHYRIHLPKGQKPNGAIIFAHGYKGTAAGLMKNTALLRLADDLGVALVATKSARGDWDIPGTPANMSADGREEYAYYDAVLDDVTKRFGVNEKRIVMTGFSAGGMMVWNLACHHNSRFAGFVALSGTFWHPVPATCFGGVANIIHIHGDSDPVVPLKGRKIAQTRQGSVLQALKMYRRYGKFGPAKEAKGRLLCRQRSNLEGNILEFCQFSGGHSFAVRNIRHGWERLQAAGAL